MRVSENRGQHASTYHGIYLPSQGLHANIKKHYLIHTSKNRELDKIRWQRNTYQRKDQGKTTEELSEGEMNSLSKNRIKVMNIEVLIVLRSFPGGSVVKNLSVTAGDVGLISGSGRSPGEGNGNPLQYSCLGNPMHRGTWQATVHRDHKKVGHDLATKQYPQEKNR